MIIIIIITWPTQLLELQLKVLTPLRAATASLLSRDILAAIIIIITIIIIIMSDIIIDIIIRILPSAF